MRSCCSCISLSVLLPLVLALPLFILALLPLLALLPGPAAAGIVRAMEDVSTQAPPAEAFHAKLLQAEFKSSSCSCEMRDLPAANGGRALPSISGSVQPLPTRYPCIGEQGARSTVGTEMS